MAASDTRFTTFGTLRHEIDSIANSVRKESPIVEKLQPKLSELVDRMEFRLGELRSSISRNDGPGIMKARLQLSILDGIFKLATDALPDYGPIPNATG